MTSPHAVRPGTGESGARRLVVSFSGLDGAGKTHQISALQEWLAVGGRSSEVLWIPFRIWPESLINRLPAALRSRLGPKRRAMAEPGGVAADVPAPHGVVGTLARLAGRLARVAWILVAGVASVSAGLSLRRRVAHSPASVVILDRYRLDTIVKLQYWYGDVPPQLLAWIVRRLAPEPDVELLLRVDPEVAYARKPEQWSPAQLARQASRYDALVAGGVVVLDGTEPPDHLAAQVRRRVEAAARDD